MGNFFNEGVLADFKERIGLINENTERKWGEMDAAQMLKHLDITYKMGLGLIKAPADKLKPILSTPIGKWLMIKKVPWFRNMATAKSLIVHERIDLETIKEDLFATMDDFSKKDEDFKFGEHPIFGKLNKKEWGALQYKHTQHHLQQFSV